MKMLIAAGLAAALLTPVLAGALDAAPVNLRQANQSRRIDAGVRSGKLTHREAARLRAQQSSIKREEDRMRARHGGHLTRHDKAIIHSRQNHANRAILSQKHDAQHGRNKLKL